MLRRDQDLLTTAGRESLAQTLYQIVQLANSSLTVGSTSISLGATATTVTGLTSLTSTTLEGTTTVRVGAADAANGIVLNSSGITFEALVLMRVK